MVMKRNGNNDLLSMGALDSLSQELRLAVYATALYVTFIIWGYLQERITTAQVTIGASQEIRWGFPFVLNTCMAFTTYGTAYAIEGLSGKRTNHPRKLFWRPALAAVVASPLGYASLKYINYPLMVLTKSSKPVPIMLIGSIFFQQTYQWYKYASIALLCVGISMFTFAQSSGKTGQVTQNANVYSPIYALYGVVLILLNLAMDGYTNNEQDRLYSEHPISAVQMMKQTNLWQCGFQAAYLFLGLCVFGQDSELLRAMRMISYRPSLCVEIALFCACAALGQVLIFRVVKEFGSLVWVTISVTRQLFTILLSVMLFGHHVNAVQWLGVILVFAGLGIDIAAGYGVKLKSDFGWDGKLESLVDVLTRCVQDALAGDVAGSGSASRVGRAGAGSVGGGGAGGIATTGLARPGLASRSGSTDFVDIEGQVAASPGSATATRKRWTAGSDKNKAD